MVCLQRIKALEQRTLNPQVEGSSPSRVILNQLCSCTRINNLLCIFGRFIRLSLFLAEFSLILLTGNLREEIYPYPSMSQLALDNPCNLFKVFVKLNKEG